MTKKRILFISNDARRAGAQLLLIGFLRWLKERDTTICFDILLADGGELEPDFQDLGAVYRWDKSIPLPFCDSIFITVVTSLEVQLMLRLINHVTIKIN